MATMFISYQGSDQIIIIIVMIFLFILLFVFSLDVVLHVAYVTCFNRSSHEGTKEVFAHFGPILTCDTNELSAASVLWRSYRAQLTYVTLSKGTAGS